MNLTATELVVLAAYASLVVELVVFPIPSEASTWQLLAAEAPADAPPADALQQARARSRSRKLLTLFLPTATGVVLWLLPLACILVPGVAAAIWCTQLSWLHAPGLALVVLGRLVTFTSVLQLRAQRRRGAGPGWLFRHSRNPGLVGMYACYLGLCCLSGSPLLWLGLPLYVANMHGRVRMEEAHLSARLGATWNDYAARVPRYLGR
jgi:protein-S-isoprenylcysteine O-methyltransferase Ste14